MSLLVLVRLLVNNDFSIFVKFVNRFTRIVSSFGNNKLEIELSVLDQLSTTAFISSLFELLLLCFLLRILSILNVFGSLNLPHLDE